MKQISPKRAAEMWCELNCWESPAEYSFSGGVRRKQEPLKKEEMWGAMRTLEFFTTSKLIDQAWAERHPKKGRKERVVLAQAQQVREP